MEIIDGYDDSYEEESGDLPVDVDIETWISMQQNTFTNWVNENLKKVNLKIDNIQYDFSNGLNLIALVEVLQNKKIGRFVKKPINQHQQLENVTIALRAITDDGVKLVNIGSEDIVNGNLKLILGLIWSLIGKYQIRLQFSNSKVPPKRLMLAWLRAVIPDCDIRNFTTDWNDGLALSALIDYCRPGIVPKWRSLNRRDGLSNCSKAMRVAMQNFDIPMILRPENMSSPSLDELSSMTYLSYFMKPNSPGYLATLNFVRQTTNNPNLNNLTTDWNDGWILCSLVDALGGKVPGFPNLDRSRGKENNQTGIDVAQERFTLDPILSADEMTDPRVDHLGVMAYAASFHRVRPLKPKFSPKDGRVDGLLPTYQLNQKSGLRLNAPESDLKLVSAEASSPSGRVQPLRLSEGAAGSYETSFAPNECGQWRISFLYNNEHIHGSPFWVDCVDLSAVRVYGIEDGITVGKPHELTIDCSAAGSSDPKVIITNDGRSVATSLHEGNKGTYIATFTPYSPGQHAVSVQYGGQEVPGSPFEVNVVDKARISASGDGLRKAQIGRTATFKISADTAKQTELSVTVTSPSGVAVPSKIRGTHDEFTVEFSPDEVGDHRISVFYLGHPVSEGLVCHAYNPNAVIVQGIPDHSLPNTPVNFTIDAQSAGVGELEIMVNRGETECKVQPAGRRRFNASFIPREHKTYKVEMYFNREHVPGSPWNVRIDNIAEQLHVRSLPKMFRRNRSGVIELEAPGLSVQDLKAEAVDLQGRKSELRARPGRNEGVELEWTPSRIGPHKINILAGGVPIPDSPFSVKVFDNESIIVNTPSQTIVGARTKLEIDLTEAGEGELNIIINGGEIECQVEKVASKRVVASFTPSAAKDHMVAINFNGAPVRDSPFRIPVASLEDAVRTTITELKAASVTRAVDFEIETSYKVEKDDIIVHVTNDRGNDCPVDVREVREGLFKVEFHPQLAGVYRIDVHLGKIPIPGSPFMLRVYDEGSVAAEFPSQGFVGQEAQVPIDLTDAGDGELFVNIDKGRTSCRVEKVSARKFAAVFTPERSGACEIEITFNGRHINGSPFDLPIVDLGPRRVNTTLTALKNTRLSQFLDFEVETGGGQLTVLVKDPKNTTVPSIVRRSLRDKVKVEFSPTLAGTYLIDMQLDGSEVEGSPFALKIFDEQAVHVSAPTTADIGKEVDVLMDMSEAGEGQLDVNVNAGAVDCKIEKVGSKKYQASFIPITSGLHQVTILFNGYAVPSSPLPINVRGLPTLQSDLALEPVRVGELAKIAIQADLDSFHVEPTVLNSKERRLESNLKRLRKGEYEIEFIPETVGQHRIQLIAEGKVLSERPIIVKAYNEQAVKVNLPKNGKVGYPMEVSINVSEAGEGSLSVAVDGGSTPCRIEKGGSHVYVASFVPQTPGKSDVAVTFNGLSVPGSVFSLRVYDESAVRLLDVPREGIVGEAIVFRVDVSDGGDGRLEVSINDGTIPCQIESDGHKVYLASFIPEQPGQTKIEVTFNGKHVTGSPILCSVSNAVDFVTMQTQGTLGSDFRDTGRFVEGVTQFANVNDQIRICVHGSGQVNPELYRVEVSAPNRTRIPVSSVQQQRGGDVKVEFNSRYVGRHAVDVYYNDEKVAGCPYFVEVFDPNRVRLDHLNDGEVHQNTDFSIDVSDAGKADLECRIVGPSGEILPPKIQQNGSRVEVSYKPVGAGPHNIYTTYGGVDVIGSPHVQNITDGGVASANGAGLEKAIEGKPTHFLVNAAGLRGNLYVQVDGPQTIAKCQIDPEGKGMFRVTYIPMEVGVFNILIKWNDKMIAGSPFRPIVLNPSEIRLAHGAVDDDGRISAEIAKPKLIPLRTSRAGPGELTTRVVDPQGVELPARISPLGADGAAVSFSPQMEGTHRVHVWFSGFEVPDSPFSVQVGSPKPKSDASRVRVSGSGLSEAKVDQEALFVIDASEAGAAQPEVVMNGLRYDVDVTIDELGGKRFRCSYVPTAAGAYLIHISWGGQTVPGSPYQVNVSPSSDASKVFVGAESLRTGILGQEISTIIDTRVAGPGELTVYCSGPSKTAQCELVDRHDGTFRLIVRPREAGRHKLSIKYGGDHVPGSSFTLTVHSPPDARKVRVFGPGIDHGILASFDSRFWCDTKGAGAGQLTVRIRGPKGAFRVEMQREGQRDRLILCRYKPEDVGDYIIHVEWSGVPVPNSPFQVQIFDTELELNEFLHPELTPKYANPVGADVSPLLVTSTAGYGRTFGTLPPSLGY